MQHATEHDAPATPRCRFTFGTRTTPRTGRPLRQTSKSSSRTTSTSRPRTNSTRCAARVRQRACACVCARLRAFALVRACWCTRPAHTQACRASRHVPTMRPDRAGRGCTAAPVQVKHEERAEQLADEEGFVDIMTVPPVVLLRIFARVPRSTPATSTARAVGRESHRRGARRGRAPLPAAADTEGRARTRRGVGCARRLAAQAADARRRQAGARTAEEAAGG